MINILLCVATHKCIPPTLCKIYTYEMQTYFLNDLRAPMTYVHPISEKSFWDYQIIIVYCLTISVK